MAFPNVVATSVGNSGIGSGGPYVASSDITLPAGVASGDLLLINLFDRNENGSLPAGWTALVSDGFHKVFGRIADGTEGATVTVTFAGNGSGTWTCYRYDVSGGWLSLADIAISAGANGDSGALDPPSLTPADGAQDWSWVALGVWHLELYDIDTYPTNMPNDRVFDKGGTSATWGGGACAATRDENTTTLDPDTFDWQFGTSYTWKARTLAVRFGLGFAPPSFGSEAGFQAGVAFEVGGDVGLFPKRMGVEAGFTAGVTFRTAGQRRLMLTGAGIETPEMAPLGTVGQAVVVTADGYGHADIAGGTDGSLYIDLDVSGAHTVDRDDGATHDLTLTGDATFTLAGAVTDEATDIRLIIRQDGTGGWEVTWPGSVVWADGTEPVLQTDPYAVDTIGLLTVDDGTTWFGYHVEAAGSAGTPATTVESETTWGIAPAVGSDTEYARQDHTHGSPAEPTTGGFAPILIADDHSNPLIFADLLQTEDGDDLLYFDGG